MYICSYTIALVYLIYLANTFLIPLKNLLANVESLEITEDATQDLQRSIGEDVLSSGDLDIVNLNSDRTDAQDDTKPSNDDVQLLTANDNKDQQENEQVTFSMH